MKIAVLILLLLAIPLQADQMFDAWSGWHVMGSFMLVHFLDYYGCSLTTSWFVAFGLGVLWEVADMTFGKRCPAIFDSRGFADPRDIFCDFIGCTIRVYFDKRRQIDN